MRTCPFSRCTRRIPSSHFACRKHWFEVPKGERDLISASYALYLTHKLTIHQLRRIQRNVVARVEGSLFAAD